MARHTPEIARVLSHTPEFLRVFRHSPEFLRVFRHVPEFLRVFRHIPEFFRFIRHTPELFRLWRVARIAHASAEAMALASHKETEEARHAMEELRKVLADTGAGRGGANCFGAGRGCVPRALRSRRTALAGRARWPARSSRLLGAERCGPCGP